MLDIEGPLTSLLALLLAIENRITLLLASESLAPACMLAGGAIVVILLLAEVLRMLSPGRLRTSVRSVALVAVAVAGGLAAYAAGKGTALNETTLAWIED